MVQVLNLEKGPGLLHRIISALKANKLYQPRLLYRTFEGNRLGVLLSKGTDRAGLKFEHDLREFNYKPEDLIYASREDEMIDNSDINALTVIEEYERPVLSVYDGNRLELIAPLIYHFHGDKKSALKAAFTIDWIFNRKKTA